MRGRLVVDPKLLTEHYLGNQRGGNIVGFRGPRFQRGYGIGGTFKSLSRFAIPLFKQSAKAVGKRALQTATKVGQDVLGGKNVVESAKGRGKQAVNDVVRQGANSILLQGGGGKRKHAKVSGEFKSAICDKEWITDEESDND